MLDMPIVHLRLERMAETIQHAMTVHNEEVNEFVAKSVKLHMESPGLEEKLHEAIGQAINGAIEKVSKWPEVQEAASKLVAASIRRATETIVTS